MAAGVVIIIVVIIVIVIARFAGVTRAVELLVSDEGAKVIEADVTGAAVARPALAGVLTLIRWRRVLSFLLDLVGDHRRQRRRRGWWLRALPYFGLAVHLDLSRDLFWRRGHGLRR